MKRKRSDQREVNHMDDLLDLLCWLAPLFAYYWQYYFYVYYREDDSDE